MEMYGKWGKKLYGNISLINEYWQLVPTNKHILHNETVKKLTQLIIQIILSIGIMQRKKREKHISNKTGTDLVSITASNQFPTFDPSLRSPNPALTSLAVN